MNEDYTVAVLKGIPIFCVNRIYKLKKVPSTFLMEQYTFEFENGYGASVVEFIDKTSSGGYKYELAVLKYHGADSNITYDTEVTEDIERGDAKFIDGLLTRIEKLKGDWDINSIDNHV